MTGRRIPTSVLVIVAGLLLAAAWTVAANFIRVEVRMFGIVRVVRLGWALVVAAVLGMAVGVVLGRLTPRRARVGREHREPGGRT